PGQPRAPLLWARWVDPAVAVAWGLVGLALLVRWWRRRRVGARPLLVPMLCGLGVAAVVAAALTSAQLLPALEFIGQSRRAAADGAHEIYGFSLAPTRLLELVWPNVFGIHDGSNRFWLGAVPPYINNANPWVHTLY